MRVFGRDDVVDELDGSKLPVPA
jgi:hypothetical protein